MAWRWFNIVKELFNLGNGKETKTDFELHKANSSDPLMTGADTPYTRTDSSTGGFCTAPRRNQNQNVESNDTTSAKQRSSKKCWTYFWYCFLVLVIAILIGLFLAMYFNCIPTYNSSNSMKNEKDKSSALDSLCIRELEKAKKPQIQTLDLNHDKRNRDSFQQSAAECTAQLKEAQELLCSLDSKMKNLKAFNVNWLEFLYDKAKELVGAIERWRSDSIDA